MHNRISAKYIKRFIHERSPLCPNKTGFSCRPIPLKLGTTVCFTKVSLVKVHRNTLPAYCVGLHGTGHAWPCLEQALLQINMPGKKLPNMFN